MAPVGGQKSGLLANRGRRHSTIPDGSSEDHERLYFESYAHLGIHQEMIQDEARTGAYMEAIMRNADVIKGSVVLDVGCGTGILSIFAARAGARKVHAVDASDIALLARKVMDTNGLADVITVHHCRVEDLELDEKVDVIVSEWMGYMLLYETMLPAVLHARDRWLKPGGLILPRLAHVYLAPVDCEEGMEETLGFWSNVHGINMSCAIPAARKCYFSEPCVEALTPENAMSLPAVICHIDCNTVKEEDLKLVTSTFSCQSMVMASLTGFALWFSVSFPILKPAASSTATQPQPGSTEQPQGESCVSIKADGADGAAVEHSDGPATRVSDAAGGGRGCCQAERKSGHMTKGSDVSCNGDEMLVLSTGPEDLQTHWQQTVLYTDEPVAMNQDDKVEGSIEITPNAECVRFLDIKLAYRVGDKDLLKQFTMK